jgi:hypothetical protein
VLCIGQPIGAILAENREVARKATYLVKVEYEDLKPILTIEVLFVVLKKILIGLVLFSIRTKPFINLREKFIICTQSARLNSKQCIPVLVCIEVLADLGLLWLHG